MRCVAGGVETHDERVFAAVQAQAVSGLTGSMQSLRSVHKVPLTGVSIRTASLGLGATLADILNDALRGERAGYMRPNQPRGMRK